MMSPLGTFRNEVSAKSGGRGPAIKTMGRPMGAKCLTRIPDDKAVSKRTVVDGHA